ncbi:phosphoenolpyruvate synthase [Natranaeroarchaeum sulfidigenes]|uniref:Phosphoenolpyruvate synthase n=1 Tax=Natranaeroarchaeum sulfidigenes TaxID=2784880 RepID=A0A897MY31_9EURY|nr:phosphoenolpyruvate synthase [Natranaeroarchaeum sulfidigenes]QSG03245.1 Phosphoenolpyruvate synthase/pyruvate phosphate dikinase [Natranaeroarchaeum sulfidigenes]
MPVYWLDEIGGDDVDIVGGKGASLGEMTGAGLPVPPGFVVSAGTYRLFIEEAGIDDELFSAVDVDVEESDALADAAERAQTLIVETEFPEDVRTEILEAYRSIGVSDGDEQTEPFVAVRSSATAEDLPDASFAGQQETFLNIQEDGLLERIRECWASLFTQRAIYYRQKQGFDHRSVNIAVVVQRMVDADRSGVLFTSHPSTGDSRMIVEAAWGLGEAVVSGAVSPDNYVIDRADGDVLTATVADKKVMYVRDAETGETVESPVPEQRRKQRVLSDEELHELVALGERVESHYGSPQDVEWAIVDGELFLLQSRPITTIGGGDDREGLTASMTDELVAGTPDSGTTDGSGMVSDETGEGDELINGLGASPGTVTGPVRIVDKLDELDRVSEGDIIVTEMTTPDMVPAMKRAAGIVTDEGGMTSHAAIISRELGVPAVVGTQSATVQLDDGQVVTLDGKRGAITSGTTVNSSESTPDVEARPSTTKPMTATEVKVNLSIPDAAERAAALGADGVGLLRIEHMVLSLDKTPERYVADHGADAYVDELIDGIRTVADAFYPRSVRVRTLDAPTDEFRELQGGDNEPHEHNPMLGYRGIRRSLDRPDLFRHELGAVQRLYDMGYDNIELMFPLVTDAADVRRARSEMVSAGINPDKRSWGVMIETPASALRIEEITDAGVDFASFGTNDLTQYTLAVDRNNEVVADRFDELHPAVLELIESTIETCRNHGVETSICGQAGSKPDMIEFLVKAGVSSISANIDAVRDVQQEIKRVEQRLLLDSVR